jgi:hypothetical protein
MRKSIIYQQSLKSLQNIGLSVYAPLCLQMYVYGSIARSCPNFSASPARKFGQYLKKYILCYSFYKVNFWD